MTLTYKLFTTAHCHKCPAAKAIVKQSSMEGSMIDCGTAEGLATAQIHGITSVPVLLIFDGDVGVKRVTEPDDMAEALNQK